MATDAENLAQGIAQLGQKIGLKMSDEQQVQMLAYLALLKKWNKVYNLTAVGAADMVSLHLLDSLSVLPYVHANRLLDVGSGGGLPGVILAIALPNLQVTTIDTVQKKAIFMRQAKAELGLTNLEVVHGRVEAFQTEPLFEQIISRAFAEIGLFKTLTQHLLAKNGEWLAMKAKLHEEELSGLDLQNFKIHRLYVPQLEAERHLVVIKNEN